MSLIFKKQYGCPALLNQSRAFMRLVNSQKGESEIRMWIEELLKKNPGGFDIPLTQKLLKKSLDGDLSPAFMLASASIRFPTISRLPRSWRRFLTSKGVRLHLFSSFLWIFEVTRNFRQGITTYKNLMMNNQIPDFSYALLKGIHNASFSATLSGIPAQDFLAWFCSSFSFSKQWIVPASPCMLPSTEQTLIVEFPFPALSPASQAIFRKISRKLIFSAAFKMCAGMWQAAYMLSDQLEAEYVKLIPQHHLATVYGFTNADYIYRPLWTYEAQKKGSTIALFFYSTNTFNMQLSNGSDIGYSPGYSTMTWPVIYTQHKNHEQFLKNVMRSKADILIKGLIPYEDNGQEASLPGKRKILYLDVQPFRVSFMASIGRPCHIYTESISTKSFKDVMLLAKNMNASLFIKPKRYVGNRLSPSYRKMLRQAEDRNHVEILDSGISPQTLFKEVDCIICQPFTSAALFAETAGKPVVYYDAAGLFEKNQPACQGISLLHGYDELERWFLEIENVFKTAA